MGARVSRLQLWIRGAKYSFRENHNAIAIF